MRIPMEIPPGAVILRERYEMIRPADDCEEILA
jgi:hypothetical protein